MGLNLSKSFSSEKKFYLNLLFFLLTRRKIGIKKRFFEKLVEEKRII
jgi:hypothetical protein